MNSRVTGTSGSSGLEAENGEPPPMLSAAWQWAWRGFEWCESALGLIAVFVVGLAPAILAGLSIMICLRIGAWRLLGWYGIFLLVVGPPSWWVKTASEASLPLGSGFLLRVARQAVELPVRRRILWGLLWLSQMAVSAGLGVAFHVTLAKGGGPVGPRPLLAVLMLATFQVGMTLAANIYLLLASAAISRRLDFVDWVHRHRFFADLALTLTILGAAAR